MAALEVVFGGGFEQEILYHKSSVSIGVVEMGMRMGGER